MSDTYNVLNQHSSFSLKKSIARSDKVISKCSNYNIPACSITDYGSISGVPKFHKEAKKSGIKPLLGVTLYICNEHASIQNDDNRKLSRLILIAKNLAGWKTLVKIVSASNHPDNFYYSPRLSLSQLGELADKNLICISGHVYSTIGNSLWLDINGAYASHTYEESRQYADEANWETKLTTAVKQHQEIFKDLFLGIQLINQETSPASIILGKALRRLSRKLKIPAVAIPCPHYIDQTDADDQRLVVCDGLKATLRAVTGQLKLGKFVGSGGFFRSDNYHLPEPSEMIAIHTEGEIKNTSLVADMVEEYEITGPPQVPKFDTPNGISSADYLKQLCVAGWNKLIKGRIPKDKIPKDKIPIYQDRIRYELETITSVDYLPDYFLIVQDYIGAAISRGEQVGPARGSSGGSLLAYLIGIVRGKDPIEMGLFFERFLNKARLKGMMPDIDTDFMQVKREDTIEYIRNKYGHDRVAQVVTFSQYKGRSALKAVLRAREACGAAEQHECSKNVFSEAAITDDLQEMVQEGRSKSVIQLSLEDNAKKLEKWAQIKGNEIVGDFAPYFKQAMRLEYIESHMGKHASAVIIGAVPISEVVPLINIKGELLAGMDYHDCEDRGLLKNDILGLSTLDNIKGCLEYV